MKLGGTQAASFDVTKIGRAAQYRGFGAFSKIDSGTWTLEGETDAVMPWAVSGGTLAISSKRGLGDDKGQLNLDGGTLKTIKEMELTKSILLSDKGGTIENEKALTLSGPILQSGLFTKTGAGRLALLAKNTYKGETIVESGELNIAAGAAITSNTTVKRLGRLSVDGTAQDVTLDSGSRISGVGTIGDLTVKYGATVSPGNSVGTLHLGKDVTFNKSSIFDVEIKHDFSQADQLSVQGSAKLLGGVVDIRLENDLAVLTEDMGKSLLSKSYNILVAANGVTGQFDGVLSRYNYINPKLNYAATQVVLGFELAPTVKAQKLKIWRNSWQSLRLRALALLLMRMPSHWQRQRQRRLASSPKSSWSNLKSKSRFWKQTFKKQSWKPFCLRISCRRCCNIQPEKPLGRRSIPRHG